MRSLALLSALLSVATALAAPVLVVRTSQLGPYKTAEKAFAAALGQEVRSLNPTTESSELAEAINAAPFVLAIGPGAARTVVEAKPRAPTLYALVSNPEKEGLSSADIRNKLVPMFVPPSRQARAIRELLPSAKRIGLLYDPSNSAELSRECRSAASAAGFTLVATEVHSKKEVAAATRGLIGKVDALWLIPDATVISAESFKFMVQMSLETKVPLIGFSEGMTKAGALLSLEAEYEEIGRNAASTARKALGGTVTSPDAPDGTIYLNGRTATLISIPIPASLKRQAANVFQ